MNTDARSPSAEDDLKQLSPDELIARILELQSNNQQLAQRVEQLEELFRLAQLKRFAPSSEKLKDRVFDEAEQAAVAEPVEDDPDGVFALPDTGLPGVDAPAHQKRGRKPLPADLPRTRIEYDLPDEQKVCACCQGAMHRMGEQTSEQLHIEVKASVLQHVRFKYACRHCERHAEHTPIVIAPMPAQPLPGSNASPAMIATVMTAKYADGTPLYRMEDGAGPLEHRGQSWHAGALDHPAGRTALLSRLYDAMRGTLLSQSLIHGDETTVQVLKEDGKTAQSKSYMWVYRSAEACVEPVVLFEYQPGRGQQYPQAFLKGYAGTLMSDGYSAWRTLEGVTQLGCMAHARRAFDEAYKAHKKPDGRARKALEYFKSLYQVETLARAPCPRAKAGPTIRTDCARRTACRCWTRSKSGSMSRRLRCCRKA
jgi:transposase